VGFPKAIASLGSSLRFFSLHSSAQTLSGTMTGSRVDDCTKIVWCCTCSLSTDSPPDISNLHCVHAQYRVVQDQRHQGVRVALNARMKTSRQSVRGHSDTNANTHTHTHTHTQTHTHNPHTHAHTRTHTHTHAHTRTHTHPHTRTRTPTRTLCVTPSPICRIKHFFIINFFGTLPHSCWT